MTSSLWIRPRLRLRWSSPVTTRRIASTRAPLLGVPRRLRRGVAAVRRRRVDRRDGRRGWRRSPPRGRRGSTVLSLQPNGGKAEAVRRGMLAALERGAGVVGYLDADLSTPPARDLPPAGGVRAPRRRGGPGRARGAARDRHRAERGAPLPRAGLRQRGVAAILRARVYDTQCGAKLFRASPALEAALATPVPLALGVRRRAARAAADRRRRAFPGCRSRRVVEVPLTTWHDVKGSKLSPVAMARSLGRSRADRVRRGRAPPPEPVGMNRGGARRSVCGEPISRSTCAAWRWGGSCWGWC